MASRPLTNKDISTLLDRTTHATGNIEPMNSRMVPERIVNVRTLHDSTLSRLLIDRKRIESMLCMLEGNTEPADIQKLRNEWLVPILESLADLGSQK